MDPLIKLAANATPGEKRYVCFAGAGLSIDAGVPTAWGLMLATAKLLWAGENDGEPDDREVESWFMQSDYAKQRYDQLIGDLFPTPACQRDFMRDKLRADEPGRAHRLLAKLAKSGVLRCIITTNFDTLIEEALREVGLTVQVIANNEQLRTSGPLIQCREFRLYKPHGTIEGGRLRNTPADLEHLTGPMERELARVISDHGLIVLGYSGADKTIRRIFEKKRQYLYPTFWVNPHPPSSDVPPLFGSGTFDHIACTGAAAFFDDLLGMYRKLDALVPSPGIGSLGKTAAEAVLCGRPDAAAHVKRFWQALDAELLALDPFDSERRTNRGHAYQDFIAAIDRSIEAVKAFTALATTIAEVGSETACQTMYLGFESLAGRYFLPRGVGGLVSASSFDFFRFIGHELFVILIAALIRQDHWELVGRLLQQDFYIDNPPDGMRGLRTYEYLAPTVTLFDVMDRQGSGIIPSHTEKLRERHCEGELAELAPMLVLAEADFFLGLRSAFAGSYDDIGMRWGAWSAYYLSGPPQFLFRAQQKFYAQRLLEPLGVMDIEQFRRSLANHKRYLGGGTRCYRFVSPTREFDENSIGSR